MQKQTFEHRIAQ